MEDGREEDGRMWKRYRGIEKRAGVGKFFSVSVQLVNVLGFMAHMVSVITTQLSYCRMKLAWVLITLYIYKTRQQARFIRQFAHFQNRVRRSQYALN